MEIANDKEFERSLDLLSQCTEHIDMFRQQKREEGILTGEEIEASVEPIYCFREGIIDDIIEYHKKRNKI